MLAAEIESLHQAPTAVCSAAESAMAYALSALMDPELPVNMSVVVAASGMSQQRVWSKAEAPLNILSKVVTLETARKRTCVCVRVWIGMWRKQAYEGKEMYVRHIRMRGERERKKSSKEVHFFLSIIMDGRQLKFLTYPR